jgi:hypothetical protein
MDVEKLKDVDNDNELNDNDNELNDTDKEKNDGKGQIASPQIVQGKHMRFVYLIKVQEDIVNAYPMYVEEYPPVNNGNNPTPKYYMIQNDEKNGYKLVSINGNENKNENKNETEEEEEEDTVHDLNKIEKNITDDDEGKLYGGHRHGTPTFEFNKDRDYFVEIRINIPINNQTDITIIFLADDYKNSQNGEWNVMQERNNGVEILTTQRTNSYNENKSSNEYHKIFNNLQSFHLTNIETTPINLNPTQVHLAHANPNQVYSAQAQFPTIPDAQTNDNDNNHHSPNIPIPIATLLDTNIPNIPTIAANPTVNINDNSSYDNADATGISRLIKTGGTNKRRKRKHRQRSYRKK